MSGRRDHEACFASNTPANLEGDAGCPRKLAAERGLGQRLSAVPRHVAADGRAGDRYATLAATIEALATRRLSSAELVGAAIDRITAEDPAINAVPCRDFARARATAAAADAMLARGERRPLLGVPITVKETLRVQDLPSSWGLPDHRDWVPRQEGEVVSRLRAAGAVILGKTNVAAGMSDWQTANLVYGTTNNPYDLDRTPSGSSGGGAAAVAAGFTCLDVGSDLLGSIRLPSHFCGIYGLRPSAGLVPRQGHAFPATLLPNELCELGPMTRSAADLGVALDVLAGPAETPPPPERGLRGHRILLLDEHPLTRTSRAIRAAVRSCGEALAAAGAIVSDDAGDLLQLADDTRIFLRLMAPYNAVRLAPGDYAHLRDAARARRTDDDLASFALRACFAPVRDWTKARELGLRRRLAWDELFTRVDLVLCPAAPTQAFCHDHRPFEQRRLTIDGEEAPYFNQACWSTSPSLCGLPAAVFPWTWEDGLPLGLQVIGPHGGDRGLIRFLADVENLAVGFRPPPVPPRQQRGQATHIGGA